jgi:RecA-family ATPase
MNVVESTRMRELRAELNGMKALPLIATSKWQDETAPARMWLLDQWLPLARGTFLTGKGGSGKSLLAQQLATCVALGRASRLCDLYGRRACCEQHRRQPRRSR